MKTHPASYCLRGPPQEGWTPWCKRYFISKYQPVTEVRNVSHLIRQEVLLNTTGQAQIHLSNFHWVKDCFWFSTTKTKHFLLHLCPPHPHRRLIINYSNNTTRCVNKDFVVAHQFSAGPYINSRKAWVTAEMIKVSGWISPRGHASSKQRI